MSANLQAAPLPADFPAGIYVHIPFCRYVCPYCDFNVYANQQDLIPAYIEALETELRLVTRAHPPLGPSPSLFIGGGTPSLLNSRQIERIIDASVQHIGLAPDAEITMESNPDNLDPAYCAALKSTGVNRLSIGVQSAQAPGLKVLGRLHGVEGGSRAIHAARAAGFDNLSLDFIYGWPGQTLAQWSDDLTRIIDWQPEHVSLYALIIEPGTPYETAVRRGRLHPVDDDTTAGYFDLAVERLAGDGWQHYEISNWAHSPERRSLHNQLYWLNGRYYGIGAGAHAFLGDVRSSNVRLPATYIGMLAAGRLPVANEESIGRDLAMGETMMLGLRLLLEGVSASAFARRHGASLSERYGALIERFEALGLMERDDDRLRLSPKGALVSNSVLAEFLP